MAESLGTRRGRRSSAPRGEHRRCNLKPATATGPRRSQWPARSSKQPAARYQTRWGRARIGAVRQFSYRTNLPDVISLIAFAVCTVARERLIPQEEFHFVGVVSTRGASRSQHKSTNCLRFCEASLLRTYTSQNKYYRVHVQNKVTSNTRFQFTAIKDSWAHGARGLSPGAISSLPRL